MACAAGAATPVAAPASTPVATHDVPGAVVVLQPCRLDGLATAARCGSLRRPLDPSRPEGVQIDIRFAVVPAVSRHAAADPVFFFAGGPGQSAVALAGALTAAHARLNQRRDLVFVDLRGTGGSAPLACADDDPAVAASQPLAQQFDADRQAERLRACRRHLQTLPYGDLRLFTTPLAVADVDAVRAALGVARLNAIGASYGTRVVLEYLRRHPQRIRRAVLDGVAPPDLQLPEAASADNQAALDAWLAACTATPACAQAWPELPARWHALLASLPQRVLLPDPVSGQAQPVVMTRDTLLALVRAPLYQPALAAALPAAIGEAGAGRWAPLLALADAAGFGSAGGGRGPRLYSGLHLSVVCSEDLPDDTAQAASAANAPPRGADFGDSFARRYRQACADWPRARLPDDWARLPPAVAPVWLLSGGLDPATPPRHAARVAIALGARARHTVVANAGHGVATLPCLREAVQRFIGTERDDDALALAAATDCAAATPRPPVFLPPTRTPAPAVEAAR